MVRRQPRPDDSERAKFLLPKRQTMRDQERKTQPLRLLVGSDARRQAREDDLSAQSAGSCVPDAGGLAGGPSAFLQAGTAVARMTRLVCGKGRERRPVRGHQGSTFEEVKPPYLRLVSRRQGDPTSVNRMIASPVRVLMSWCRLNALTPVTSRTIASRTGRAVATRCVRTCFKGLSPSRREAS